MRAVYTFIAEEQATPTNVKKPWTVSEMCQALEVSRSGYYDWVDRAPLKGALTDRRLEVEIAAIWECSRRTYRVRASGDRMAAKAGLRGVAQAGRPVDAPQQLGRRVGPFQDPYHDRGSRSESSVGPRSS